MIRVLTVAGMMLLGTAGSAVAEMSSALVSPYLKIQVALAGDSMDGVAAAAAAIADEAATLGDEGAPLAAAAAALREAEDLAAARAAFEPLSVALIAYGRAAGFGDLRVAYCPMVDAAWVQEDGSIANPYYGAMMLTCGSFE